MLNEAPNDNDSLLIQKFNQGSPGSFNKIYYRFRAPLYYFAYKLINDHQGSEEIANDSFVKLFRIHDRFDTISNIKAFLYITTRNACLDWLKRKQVEIKRFGRKIEVPDDIHSYNTSESDRTSIQTEVLENIFAEVEALPPVCRKIFKMRYIDGNRVTDIANKLGLEKGTVSTQLKIAVRRLKGSLKLLTLMLFIRQFFLSL